MSRGRRNRARGLTLFEVVISVALIAMLFGALLTFFWQTLELREATVLAADRTAIVQQTLRTMTMELQNAVAAESFGFPIQKFHGDRRSITFVTTPLPPKHSYTFYRESEWDFKPTVQHDLIEVTYMLWIDPNDTTEEGDPVVGGILRTERRALKPYETEEDVPEGEDLLYLRHELRAPELGYLEFRYFDGVDWTTTWEVAEGNPLPHLVQITVGFDSLKQEELEDQDLEQYPLDQYPLGPDVEEINRFRVMVRIPGADQMFTSRAQRLGSEIEQQFITGGLEGMGLEGLEGLEGMEGLEDLEGLEGEEALEQLRRMAEEAGYGAEDEDQR